MAEDAPGGHAGVSDTTPRPTENASMPDSTTLATLLATLLPGSAPLVPRLLPLLARLATLLLDFRCRPITPAAALALEQDLQALLRQVGRLLLEWLYNHLEPDNPQRAPQRLRVEGIVYRRRTKTPATVASL